jgi:hypothetical protein
MPLNILSVFVACLLFVFATVGAAQDTNSPIPQDGGKAGKIRPTDKGKLPNRGNGITGSLKAIRIEGEIGENFSAQLAMEIIQFPEAVIEIGDSPGGLIEEAIRAGRILRNQGKTVVAKGSCASACVLVFAGGSKRQMDEIASLGVHRSTWGHDDLRMTAEEVQEATARIGQFYIDMGVSAEILVLQLKTPIDQMAWISRNEARDYGFID